MTTLDTLPNEILSLVTNHLERPRDVLYLSLASRRLLQFAKLDGWKAFLKGRFGLSGLDLDARNAVHGMTTLCRNWHRKGFLARYLEPATMTKSINDWEDKRWRGPRGQTMGYQPSIDSYEELHGAWDERKEVLAWSAGTQIVVRIKETGLFARQQQEIHRRAGDSPESTTTFDAFGHCNSWFTYKIPESFEGRDDITSLKLLRPHQQSVVSQSIIFGTASGRLSLLSWDACRQDSREQQYDTSGRTVGSVAVSAANKASIAATLGDSTLALYPTGQEDPSEDPVEPLSEVSPFVSGNRTARIWSCSFLSNDKVAVGLGPSHEPIQMYEILPSGFTSQPLRTFNLEPKFWKGTESHQAVRRNTSVYPILPIPGTSQSGSDAGNIFLSGGYDGLVRLHDVRSPHGFETMFWDPTNDSSVYSLAIQDLERIVAGVSMHSMIKVFDLRLSGSHAYETMSLSSRPENKSKGQDHAYNTIVNEARNKASTMSGGWNLFLNPRHPPRGNAYREDYWRGGQASPVYSLSIPSSTSPNVYAGLEGAVQSLTFHSVADRHPDPLLSENVVRFEDSNVIDVKTSYDPRGEVLKLGMYEQGTEEGLGMHLLIQDEVAANVSSAEAPAKSTQLQDPDERWKDIRNESDRWARGDVPPAPGPGRGRGRSRGRGRGGRRRGGGGRARGA